VKELKAFERISLSPGEKRTVNFELSTDMLHFHNQEMKKVVEPGKFKLWVARDASDEEHEASFEVVK
jgi:beta-glucosidase